MFGNGTVGVIGMEEKHYERGKTPPLDQFFIDVGAKDKASCPVKVGDAAGFRRPFEDLGDRLVAKTMDDRIGCAILIETLRKLRRCAHDVYFVFTVQEEMTLAGAGTSAYGINPDMALAVDVTDTGDTPESNHMAVSLGGGPAIKVQDSGMVAHAGVKELMVRRAEEAKLPYQLEVLDRRDDRRDGDPDGARGHPHRLPLDPVPLHPLALGDGGLRRRAELGQAAAGDFGPAHRTVKQSPSQAEIASALRASQDIARTLQVPRRTCFAGGIEPCHQAVCACSRRQLACQARAKVYRRAFSSSRHQAGHFHTAGTPRLAPPRLVELARQVAQLRADGREVIVVSSGAMAAGRERLDFPQLPKDLPAKQMLAAIGQPRLMAIYEQIFGLYGLTIAQVLLTRADLADRRRYLNSRNTLTALLEHGIIPIVNENDTVATEEIRVGDNDNLSALVANLIDADLLVLLTDQAGLFTADPRLDPTRTVGHRCDRAGHSRSAVAGRGRNGQRPGHRRHGHQAAGRRSGAPLRHDGRHRQRQRAGRADAPGRGRKAGHVLSAGGHLGRKPQALHPGGRARAGLRARGRRSGARAAAWQQLAAGRRGRRRRGRSSAAIRFGC